MVMNKKAAAMYKDWAEIFFFIVMVLGFLISLSIRSTFLVYLTIFISGGIAGRLIYNYVEKMTLPYYLISIGFLIGYLIGSPVGDKKVIIILFVLGGLISYYLFDRGFLHDLPY